MLRQLIVIVIIGIGGAVYWLPIQISNESVGASSTFFSIAIGINLTILSILFKSEIAHIMSVQKEINKAYSTLDELFRRLRNALFVCIIGLVSGFIFTCCSPDLLLFGFYDINIHFIISLSLISAFVLSVCEMYQTFRYLTVLIRLEVGNLKSARKCG